MTQYLCILSLVLLQSWKTDSNISLLYTVLSSYISEALISICFLSLFLTVIKFNLPPFLFISLFSSTLIHYLSARHQEQQNFRNHWCKCLPVLYQKQLVTLDQNHLSRRPPSKYMCTVTPFNKHLVCQADARWQGSHEKVTSIKQSKPESMIQKVLLFWSEKLQTLLTQTVVNRCNCLWEREGSAHW